MDIFGAPQTLQAAGMNLSFQGTLGAGIAYALSLIRSRYEGNRNPANDMPFHSVEHTIGVVRRTCALLRGMGASEKECRAGIVAAAFHDTVQRWVPSPFSDGRVMRRRSTGQNEADSAAEAAGWMLHDGITVFDQQDRTLVTQAILATVPGWDAKNETIFQPKVTLDAPLVVRAVALADLGIAGMDGATFVETGDQLFREENLDIAGALRFAPAHAGLRAGTLESYKVRMLAWSRSQVGFARGRRARLEIELGNLSSTAKSAVRVLFSQFEAALTTATEAVTIREALPPWEVARAMGYSIPGEVVAHGQATRTSGTVAEEITNRVNRSNNCIDPVRPAIGVVSANDPPL
ncbi:MAG TPA: hypothetical protein VND64_04415 [Pirellulales bacterium]|nr:hypothetical protein [Pirellulales bacterium]